MLVMFSTYLYSVATCIFWPGEIIREQSSLSQLLAGKVYSQ